MLPWPSLTTPKHMVFFRGAGPAPLTSDPKHHYTSQVVKEPSKPTKKPIPTLAPENLAAGGFGAWKCPISLAFIECKSINQSWCEKMWKMLHFPTNPLIHLKYVLIFGFWTIFFEDPRSKLAQLSSKAFFLTTSHSPSIDMAAASTASCWSWTKRTGEYREYRGTHNGPWPNNSQRGNLFFHVNLPKSMG